MRRAPDRWRLPDKISSVSERRIIKPGLSSWKLREREEELFATAKEIPAWRLANVARKALTDITKQLSGEMTIPKAEKIGELTAEEATQLAVVQMAMLIVRETGAIVALISTGHEREAWVHGRIALESVLRARQCRGDKSGEAARALLKHRPHGTLKSIAKKFGSEEELKFLDRFAHASPITLTMLATSKLDPDSKEFILELQPMRGTAQPTRQLYMAAYTAGQAMALLAETFEVSVEIPHYMGTNLKVFRDNPPPPNL